ncbi:transient receptor potential cation channel subfamily V member 2 isoform X1 [Thamnophis elegans]|uniref:transient receptor potential cation channel subfamily V member 2 isoform X1 n=1 Tax=Thamnophis elegans TaxID=35005 RepID=UPI001376F7F3|nr:transient receptor potential cation channel subfamily V member 2 isoform X1 [Thamnophis elegans]XP_032072859.1 transient receptor potential cation channel subfamily V member 2 isoform X1 [Thamnophis elegans]
MSKSRFALETDDGPVEDLNAATKGTAGAEHGLPPLETPFQKEAPPSPQIRVNLNYRPGLVPPDDPNRFDRDRIFQAVVAGDPERLNGLSDYLQRTSSFLTDTKFRDGKTGKTCLMKALLHLKDGHNPTIPLLLEIDKETDNPKSLVNTACTDSYYKGHTALHIAIEKRNLDLVKILVQNEADVHIKASGHFFQPHRKGTFYFGELPLSLAACTNQPEVVMYLLDNEYQKARLTEQDSMGNTVLHALVMVANDTEKNTELVVNMYDMILMKGAEIDPSCKLEEIVNKKQLTPLKLAAKTGKVEILKHMLHREMKDPKFQHLSRKFTEWTYGPIHISLYDLTSIDSFEENSMLEILAYSSNTPNRYKMVALEPVNQLLQYKWESFSRKRFFFSLFLHLIFMLIYTGTAYYRPLNGEPLVPTTVTFPKLLRLIGAVVILIGGIYLFIAQSFYFWRRRFSWKSLLVDSCFEIFLFVQALAILAASVMFFASMETYVLPMVFALLLGWVNMLYYTRGLQQTGIYIVMIQKAILRDLLHFLMVYVIFLFGFATALIVLTGGASHSARNASVPLNDDSKDQAVYSGLFQTALLLFRFTIGMGDLEYNENVKYSDFAMLLVLLFVILTYILLLNMLIALMSETVTNVSGYSQSVWQLQRAIAILEIERNWIWCWRKAQRAGSYLPIGSEDKRWFFRVEEVNWEDWNEKIDTLREDPVGFNLLEKDSSSESKLRDWLARAKSRFSSLVEEEEEQEERVSLHNLRP